MSPGATAMAVILSIVGLGTVIGLVARGRHRMDLEQWTTGGRGFGLVIVWLMMAGEIYTTFAFLGASGWAYSKGGPALYIIAYLSLSSAVAFLLAPAIWSLGKAHGLQTQADLFQALYGSRALSALVALVGIAAIVPYLQLQFTGLGIIVSIASFGSISPAVAMSVGAVLIALFVIASGIRAVAGISILKDIVMISVVIFAGIAVPRALFGGIGPMFARLVALHPGHLTMPGSTPAYGHPWFISMVLLSCLGQIVWPHSLGSIYSARDGETLRRNAIALPVYNLTVPLVFIVGFSALLALPSLPKGDLAFMAVVRAGMPPWILGFVGGAGALAAIVPASVMLLTSGALFAKNVVRPVLAPSLNDGQVAVLAQWLVIALSGISLWFALRSSSTLAGLLQLGYGMVGQFFPGIAVGMVGWRVGAFAITSGILCGLALLAFLITTQRDPFLGMAAGFVALGANFAVVFLLRRVGLPDSPLVEPGAAGVPGT